MVEILSLDINYKVRLTQIPDPCPRYHIPISGLSLILEYTRVCSKFTSLTTECRILLVLGLFY